MKKYIVLILICLSFYANGQQTVRNVNLTAKVITELNEPLTAALDRHIFVSKIKELKNKDDFYILISIYPRIEKWQISEYVFDSLYSINDFSADYPVDSILPTYSISIVIASKKYYSEGWSGFNRANIFYYKYKGYDILLSSNLNLIFNTKNEMKIIQHDLIIKDDTVKISPYKTWTKYLMWNRYIAEIRLKDLIWPSWTGKRDDF